MCNSFSPVPRCARTFLTLAQTRNQVVVPSKPVKVPLDLAIVIPLHINPIWLRSFRACLLPIPWETGDWGLNFLMRIPGSVDEGSGEGYVHLCVSVSLSDVSRENIILSSNDQEDFLSAHLLSLVFLLFSLLDSLSVSLAERMFVLCGIPSALRQSKYSKIHIC